MSTLPDTLNPHELETEMKNISKCRMCFGTGKVALMRSWFVSDGHKLAKCGVCSGSGISSYKPSPDSVHEQLRIRELFGVEA